MGYFHALKLAFLSSLIRKYMLWEGFYHDFSAKKVSASGGFAPWPPPRGSAPWTPEVTSPPLTIYPGAAPVLVQCPFYITRMKFQKLHKTKLDCSVSVFFFFFFFYCNSKCSGLAKLWLVMQKSWSVFKFTHHTQKSICKVESLYQ